MHTRRHTHTHTAGSLAQGKIFPYRMLGEAQAVGSSWLEPHWLKLLVQGADSAVHEALRG